MSYIISKANKMGFEPMIGSELEFFLFNQTINLPGNIVLKGKGADSTILKFNLNGKPKKFF